MNLGRLSNRTKILVARWLWRARSQWLLTTDDTITEADLSPTLPDCQLRDYSHIGQSDSDREGPDGLSTGGHRGSVPTLRGDPGKRRAERGQPGA